VIHLEFGYQWRILHFLVPVSSYLTQKVKLLDMMVEVEVVTALQDGGNGTSCYFVGIERGKDDNLQEDI
jgi:hypothetical protein